MEGDFLDFLVEDELSSVTLLVENQQLYVHKEVLAAWSPVFRAMFVGMFKEKDMKEVELPEKKVEDFIELLHCMYPPIHPITGGIYDAYCFSPYISAKVLATVASQSHLGPTTSHLHLVSDKAGDVSVSFRSGSKGSCYHPCCEDGNVNQLLPLVEEYQILAVKKKCEEFLLTKTGSMELLITAQTYGLTQLLQKCIDFVRCKCFTELQKDPYFKRLEPENLIRILQLRVLDLESSIEQCKKTTSDRDLRLYGVINELASGYGNFCTECKSRKVNETCYNCLKMFREKVRAKCDDVKAYRNHNPLF